jgi:amino acid adenylation domain-containing protein
MNPIKLESSHNAPSGLNVVVSDHGVTTVRELIDRMAETRPEAPFLVSPETGEILTFAGLKYRSEALSEQLRRWGLERGDKVAFLMDNSLFTAQLFLGAMYGGLVSVPLNVRAGTSQLSYMVEHCDAKVVLADEDHADLMTAVMKQVRRPVRVISSKEDGIGVMNDTVLPASLTEPPAPEDVALLMYTSGSTGNPKAAVHTHRTILAGGRNSVTSHQLSSADRSLLVLPLYHINAECVTLIPTLFSGGSVVVPRRFSISHFWDWLDEYHCTWSAIVPTIVSQLLDWHDPKADQRGNTFRGIRFLRSSSAPLAPSLHREFIAKFPILLIQAMGSSEGGNIFSNPLPPAQNKIGSPGLPWGFEVRIVDIDGFELPNGEPGEMLIRGEALTSNYYKEPEATAAAFDADGWLHTGDLAYRDADGYFFVVGRSKELIIKGGVNIAPRQVDDVLESHSAVLEAAAVGIPDRHFGEDVIAFVVLRAGAECDERELLSLCEACLGTFKSPTRIYFVEDLPKGPSGKVQRLRLLEQATTLGSGTPAAVSAGFVLGRGGDEEIAEKTLPAAIEIAIAEIWADVLKVPQVQPNDNFFALGGDSLMAIQCVSRLREKTAIQLTLTEFFRNATVAEQSALIRERHASSHKSDHASGKTSPVGKDVAVSESRPRVIRDGSLPYEISPLQERLWFMERLNLGEPVYNEVEAVRLCGDLNVDALEQALNGVIARHEILRTTIKAVDGRGMARVHESYYLRLKVVDLSGLPSSARETQLGRLLTSEPRIPYHLENEPAIRATLIELGRNDHVFILMMHHLVCDWSSEGVFWRELSALYRANCRNETLILPDLTWQYGDYAVWARQQLTEKSLADDLTFWVENLRGAPPLLELPLDRPRPQVQAYRGARRRFRINRELTEAFRQLGRQHRRSLFALFTAALDALLYRYTGQKDILLGIPLAERARPECQCTIGFLLHTHVLRTAVSGELTFLELAERVQQGALDLYEHRSVPFEQVVRAVHPERSMSYSPLFQVMVNWRDRDQQLSFIGMEGLDIDSVLVDSGISKFDLTLILTDMGDEIWAEIEYSTDLFDDDRITRMFDHYRVLLEGVAADPRTTVANLPFLTSAERHQLLYAWNETTVDYPVDKCVHQLFEEQADKSPDATAVVFKNQQLSYAELNRRANRLAHYLRGLGVKPDDRVAVCVERNFEMIVALLAVLKAGAAYVPLDPAYPQDRLRWILSDSTSVALLTQAKLRELFRGVDENLPVVDLDAAHKWGKAATTNPGYDGICLSSRHLAYVIYTSGSTGLPKGVLGTHGGMVNRMQWMWKNFPFLPSDIGAAKTSLSFVDSFWEVFGYLLKGRPIVVIPTEAVKDTEQLIHELEHEGITRIVVVPSLLRMILDSGPSVGGRLRNLNLWVTSGEELLPDLVRKFHRMFPQASLINLYGSSEVAADCTFYETNIDVAARIPIGRPIANTRIYILDIHGQPVPVGVTGELHVGGAGVARGYLNRPELTAEKFLEDPFVDDSGARMYRTGDLGRWLRDGNIEYLGRNDFQVKIRGFRIELGEIEALVAAHPDVREVVVVAREDTPGDKRLVAYYTSKGGVPASAEQLRSHLLTLLPDHMVPAAYVHLERLPLSPNGKLLRRALPAPNADAYSAQAYAPPRDEVEEKLAAIWAELLQQKQVGRHDDFFALGGHSLLVFELFSRIERAFSRSIPIAAIFESPTIEQLATLIRGRALGATANQVDSEKRSIAKNSAVFQIQPGGSSAPLFIIHGAQGHIVGFQQLAALIGTGHPVYGVQAQTFVAGERGLLRVEDQAAYYISEIRKIQPKGPYYFLGYCYGGNVALEMAQQLHLLGEEIEFLGMVESRQRDCILAVRQNDSMRQRFDARFEGFRYVFSNLSLRKKATYLPKRLIARGRRWGYKVAHSIGVRSVPSFMKDTEEILKLAAQYYRPQPWHGRITLFRASVQPDPRFPRDLGWTPLAKGGLEVCDIPGDHWSVIREPYIFVLAEQIQKYLVTKPELTA